MAGWNQAFNGDVLGRAAANELGAGNQHIIVGMKPNKCCSRRHELIHYLVMVNLKADPSLRVCPLRLERRAPRRSHQQFVFLG